MKYRILLAEDEELIGEMVRLNLEQEGYQLSWVQSGDKAVDLLEREHFDLILLDVMMPGMTGFEVAKELRKRDITTPILMLTARSETSDRIHGLDQGADDYLTKPFDMGELLARARALIRRSQSSIELPSSRLTQVGAFRVNFETREAETRQGKITLSDREAGLLEMFVRNPLNSLSRADILEEVWGMDATPTERTVDNFIVRLRKFFEEDPERPRHFITVRAHGYRFHP